MKTTKKFTVFHRFLHWLMAIAMSVLFITGFLRMYWMNKYHIVSIIESKTDLIPKETMTEIAVTIREPMWEWHIVFAYVMVLAFMARIVYMLIKGIRFPNPFRKNLFFKERLQGLTYLYFYAFVFVLAMTGAFLYMSWLPEWKKSIEAVHKCGIYFFPVFIFLHLLGILISENSKNKGETSKMIGGD